MVILALAWFLVWTPLQELNAAKDALDKKSKSLSSYARTAKKEERIAQDGDADAYEQHAETLTRALADGESIYDRRANAFRQFFDGQTTAPEWGQYYAVFHERVRRLLDKGDEGSEPSYREKYGLHPNDPTDTKAKIYPELEQFPDSQGGFGQSNQSVPVDMKKYWMLEAIVQAATQLDIGGLRKIDFTDARKERKRKRSDDDNASKPSYITSTVPVAIEVQLPFAKLAPFLALLHESPTVPFSGLTSLEVTTLAEGLQSVGGAIVVEKEGDGGGRSFDEAVTEPNVEAKISLEALVWEGPAPEENPDGLEE